MPIIAKSTTQKKKSRSAKQITPEKLVTERAPLCQKKAEPLNEGTIAPDFVLQDKDGNAHTLSKELATQTIIFFYPKDNTPGCTLESRAISTALPKLKKLGVVAIGVSGGDNKSKQKFCSQNALSVLLLSDTDFRVSDSFGVYGEKTFMGRKYMGIARTTFILDANRKITKVFQNVKPEGHAQELLEYLSANGARTSRSAS